MTAIRVEQVGPEAARSVFDLVERLLAELGEEGDETGSLDRRRLVEAWRAEPVRHIAFLAYGKDGAPVGVVTVSEAFALYAQGWHGIINEMYVVPESRSAGVGEALIAAVRHFARKSGWRRIDVTAPESERWERTRRFYERQGFVFTGPKLKYLVSEDGEEDAAP